MAHGRGAGEAWLRPSTAGATDSPVQFLTKGTGKGEGREATTCDPARGCHHGPWWPRHRERHPEGAEVGHQTPTAGGGGRVPEGAVEGLRGILEELPQQAEKELRSRSGQDRSRARQCRGSLACRRTERCRDKGAGNGCYGYFADALHAARAAAAAVAPGAGVEPMATPPGTNGASQAHGRTWMFVEPSPNGSAPRSRGAWVTFFLTACTIVCVFLCGWREPARC